MSQHKTGKSPYVMLALGLAMGGLAVATLKSAQAQNGYEMHPVAGISAENMAMLRSLDNSFASLATYIEPSVVKIESSGNGGTDMFGRRMGEEKGVGTGVIFRADGWIITNDHVVAGFNKVMVDMPDGRQLPATTVREASDNDLAVVKVDATNLPAAQFGDSAAVKSGQFAMAVGAPFNMDHTVTVGHISALGRDQQIPDPRSPIGVRVYSNLIQTDTPINMGNSGGPLVNVDGQVIGINSAILSETGQNIGIGFAIPSNQARMVASELIQKGTVTEALLGIRPEDVPQYIQQEKNINGGAIVADAPQASGPAGMAGLQKGDIITRIGTFGVRNEQDVRDAMFHYAPGTTVEVHAMRGNQQKTFQVKLGDKKDYLAKLANDYKTQQGTADNQPEEENPFGGFGNPFGDGGNSFPNIPGMNNPLTHNGPANQPHTGPAKLGVSIDDPTPDLRKEFGIPDNIDGAVVTSVAPGSVAQNAGMEPGTVIQQLGDVTVHNANDLRNAMKDVKWGDTKQVKFAKYGQGSVMNQSMPITFQ